MVIKLPRSRESTPVAVTPPSTTLACATLCGVASAITRPSASLAPRMVMMPRPLSYCGQYQVHVSVLTVLYSYRGDPGMYDRGPPRRRPPVHTIGPVPVCVSFVIPIHTTTSHQEFSEGSSASMGVSRPKADCPEPGEVKKQEG